MADEEELDDEELEGNEEAEEAEVVAEPEEDPYAEIRELQFKLDLLQKAKLAQKERYKKEMHLILTPLLQKHKELQRENLFVRDQIDQLSGRGGAHSEDSFLNNLKQTIEDQKKEITVLKKMFRQQENQNRSQHHDLAELQTLKEMLEEKNDFIVELEEKNRDFVYQLEAKDDIIARISKQLTSLESDVYALNKKLQDKMPDVAQYENEINALKKQLSSAESRQMETTSGQISSLKREIKQLQQDLEYYQGAMEMVMDELEDNASVYEEITPHLLNSSADISAN